MENFPKIWAERRPQTKKITRRVTNNTTQNQGNIRTKYLFVSFFPWFFFFGKEMWIKFYSLAQWSFIRNVNVGLWEVNIVLMIAHDFFQNWTYSSAIIITTDSL